MRTLLTVSDTIFIRSLIKKYDTGKIRIGFSASHAKHPDIWIEMNGTPKITVTNEWRRQAMVERHKRMVHEIVGHLVYRMEHGMYNGLNFSTYPEKDTWSMERYRDIVGK